MLSKFIHVPLACTVALSPPGHRKYNAALYHLMNNVARIFNSIYKGPFPRHATFSDCGQHESTWVGILLALDIWHKQKETGCQLDTPRYANTIDYSQYLLEP
jgi:hypothetical protein